MVKKRGVNGAISGIVDLKQRKNVLLGKNVATVVPWGWAPLEGRLLSAERRAGQAAGTVGAHREPPERMPSVVAAAGWAEERQREMDVAEGAVSSPWSSCWPVSSPRLHGL